MARQFHLLAFVLAVALVAVGTAPTAHATCLPSWELDSLFDLAEANLQGAGFGLVDARFGFFDVNACLNASCFFQNPTSPYGFMQIPYNPEQPPLPYTLPEIGVNVSYRLLDSEAILLVGCTPPEARYFGFTPYVTWHYRPSFPGTEMDKWVNVFGSLSDTVNQATIQTFPDGPFSANAIFILTASKTAFSEIADIVAATFNVSASMINILPIPAGFPTLNLQMGLDVHSDLFSFLFRLAIPTDENAFNDWAASNPFRTVRIHYPNGTSPNVLFGTPILKPRLNDTTETIYQTAYTDMINTTIARLRGRYNIDVVDWAPNLLGYQLANYGGVCYLNSLSCAGDNRDATYLVSNVTTFFTDPTDQYITFGTNTNYNGLAVYSNLVLYNYPAAVGILDVTDVDYLDSANDPVPNFSSPTSPLTPPTVQPQFFRWTFSRTCGKFDPTCSAVPDTGFPSLPPNTPGIIATRAYQASFDTAGPDLDILIKPTLLHLVDRCRPQPCDATGSCGSLPGYTLYDIAFGSKMTYQSSTFWIFDSANAVDGQSGALDPAAVTNVENEAYWQIDLGFSRFVPSVSIKGINAAYYIILSNTEITATDLRTARRLADYSYLVTALTHMPFTVNHSFRYMRLQNVLPGAMYLTEVIVNAHCLTA